MSTPGLRVTTTSASEAYAVETQRQEVRIAFTDVTQCGGCFGDEEGTGKGTASAPWPPRISWAVGPGSDRQMPA